VARTGSGLAGGKMMRDPKAKFAAGMLPADRLAPDQPAARGAYRPRRPESNPAVPDRGQPCRNGDESFARLSAPVTAAAPDGKPRAIMSTKPQDIAPESPAALVERLARAGRAAQAELARMPSPAKEAALKLAAAALRRAAPEILAANAIDMANGATRGLTPALLDRLRLDEGRVAAMADAVDQVAGLADPVGQEIDAATRPNGMVLRRVRVPIGLIGIIYESRPNVTADAAALCVRSGNAALLRGAARRSIPTARSMPRWLPAWPKAACPQRRCNCCRRRIAPPWAPCSLPPG
jgi:glutamate-5-semialdehyde dehydrogenase